MMLLPRAWMVSARWSSLKRKRMFGGAAVKGVTRRKRETRAERYIFIRNLRNGARFINPRVANAVRTTRSHAPRGNARRDALRPVCRPNQLSRECPLEAIPQTLPTGVRSGEKDFR